MLRTSRRADVLRVIAFMLIGFAITATARAYVDVGGVNTVVRRNAPALRYCYERELRSTNRFAGRVMVHWVIEPGGTVSEVEIRSSTLERPSVERCIVEEVRRWRFDPRTETRMEVNYPFMFSPGG